MAGRKKDSFPLIDFERTPTNLQVQHLEEIHKGLPSEVKALLGQNYYSGGVLGHPMEIYRISLSIIEEDGEVATKITGVCKPPAPRYHLERKISYSDLPSVECSEPHELYKNAIITGIKEIASLMVELTKDTFDNLESYSKMNFQFNLPKNNSPADALGYAV